jgi:hypothetical protein
VRPYLEKTLQKRGLVEVAQGVGPEFKLQYSKTNKQKPLRPKAAPPTNESDRFHSQFPRFN